MRPRSTTWRALAAACLLWLCVGPATPQSRFDFDSTPGVLPKDVIPRRYGLAFELDPARPSFQATATLELQVRKTVAAIVLHAHELTAKSVELQAADGSRRTLAVSAGPVPQSWRLQGGDAAEIAPGDYTLSIAYSGKVQASDQGLYVVSYTDRGQPQRMLATQLEAVFARMLFPSFDEPAFRAVFDITVSAPAGYEVVSNMPLTRTEVSLGGAATHRFAPTPPMPSYLVALTVGRFESLGGEAAGVPLRILTAAGKREQARYALDVTQKVVPYFSDYFGVPYTLPKLDQLAVAGVRRGAMEDWGLISYAEPTVLFDPARSSPRTRRRVFDTVAHEVAHQWFGNLVTAASWEEIWLNEAFATWMAAKVTAHFNPDWHTRLQERGWVDAAMADDATTATRAIRSGPVRESSVFDVFDSITYTKGGAVLSMLEQWIGPEAFRRGLASYMNGQKLSNATAADLWHHMRDASGRDVGVVAASWTDQPGFPLVGVRSTCVAGRTRVTLTQQRYFSGPEAPSTSLWKIPVQIARGAQHIGTLLESPEQTLELEGCGHEPLVVNADGKGFYRVEYTRADLQALTRQFGALAAIDRVALLSDTFALAQAGRVPMAAYFDLLSALPTLDDESRTPLLTMASDALHSLDDALAGTPAQARVREAGRALLGPVLERLDWTPVIGESDEVSRLRGALIEGLARFDDAAVVRRARREFNADVRGRVRLPASTRTAIVAAVGEHADARQFDALMRRLKAARGEEERWMLAGALARGRDAGRARRLLASTLTGIYPANIAAAMPGMVSSSSPHGRLAYGFTLANWRRLATLSGAMFGSREELLPEAASGFADLARARALVADQRARAGPDGDAAAAKMARRIELRARVRQREATALANDLAARRISRTSGT